MSLYIKFVMFNHINHHCDDIDPEPRVSVLLYLCVSAYFLPSLHFLGDCNDDDACVMKNLKHDIGGRSTEACI